MGDGQAWVRLCGLGPGVPLSELPPGLVRRWVVSPSVSSRTQSPDAGQVSPGWAPRDSRRDQSRKGRGLGPAHRPLAPKVGGRGGSEGTWRPKTPCSQAWLPILSGVEVTRSKGPGLPPSWQQACRVVLAGNFCREGNASSPHPLAAQLLWKVSHPSRAPPRAQTGWRGREVPLSNCVGGGPLSLGVPREGRPGKHPGGGPQCPWGRQPGQPPGHGTPAATWHLSFGSAGVGGLHALLWLL